MGGLWKTTLTRKVFHLLKQKNRFGSHIWVHVSQIFDPIVLLKKILKEVTSSDQVEVESRQNILKKIQEALNDKSYLLILDDVWNEDRPTWDGFINSLLGVSSIKGNVIVVTTRSMVVASTVNALHTHKLEGLSKEDCWSIIKEKSFGKEDVPSRFEAIGIEVAKKCQGLPLAANVVGGVLHNKSEEEWRSIKDNWLSQDEGNHIRKILKLSFDNLSLPSLKKCFAYCSVFPKGHRILRHELIEYWMGEGFLVAEGSNDMGSIGDKFINVLLHNSLLQIAKRDDYGNVVSFVMHDLVHDLASSVLNNNADRNTPVRYMFLKRNVLKENAKYLRTLLMDYNIYVNTFSDFESLRVLTIGRCPIEELPSSIMKLIHLRVLDINLTRIEYLPDWIGKLVHLQTLRADNDCLRKLPSTMKYLTNLCHLHIDYRTELPAEIGRLTSLQTLECFKVGDKDGWKIEELGSLNGLKGSLTIFELERLTTKEEAEKACLSDKSKLSDLSLLWDEESVRVRKYDEDVLEGLQPHSNLKKLMIIGFLGERFPSGTQKMEVEKVGESSCVPLNNLIEVNLSNCFVCEEIPMFGQLPNLKTLKLKALYNVMCINFSLYGLEEGETRIVFPALKRLELSWMDELTEWVEVESTGASGFKLFPHLQHLKIKKCPKLKGLPNAICTPSLKELIIMKCHELKGLPNGICTLNLKELSIESCENLEDISVQQSQGSLLEHLKIINCDGLLYFPCEMIGSSLESLELKIMRSLENLPEIVECLRKSPHLTDLRILSVPEFMPTCLVEILPCFSRLKILHVDVSMEGSKESVDALLQACRHSSHSLTYVKLEGIQDWENLPDSPKHLTALKWLDLETIGNGKLPLWIRRINEQMSRPATTSQWPNYIEINGKN